MSPLLTTSYWFARIPPPFTNMALIVLLTTFSILLSVGVAAGVISLVKKDNMYWAKGGRRIAKLGIWMGLIGLLLVWMGREGVTFFGSRFWFLVWGGSFVFWAYYVGRYVIVTIPKQAADFAARARIEKYLPKKK